MATRTSKTPRAALRGGPVCLISMCDCACVCVCVCVYVCDCFECGCVRRPPISSLLLVLLRLRHQGPQTLRQVHDLLHCPRTLPLQGLRAHNRQHPTLEFAELAAPTHFVAERRRGLQTRAEFRVLFKLFVGFRAADG